MARREKTCAQLEKEIRALMEQQKQLREKKQQLFLKAFLKAAGPDVFDNMSDKGIRQFAAMIGSNVGNIVEGKPLQAVNSSQDVNPETPQTETPDTVQTDGDHQAYGGL